MRSMPRPTAYRVILLIGTFLMANLARAGNGGGIVAKAVLDGGQQQIKVDSSRTVEDSAFFNPANEGILDTAYSVQNLVTLKINEASPLYLRSAFTVTIQLRLIYSTGTATDSIDRNFTVNYDSAGTYDSRNSFVFYGGRRVTVKVLSIVSDVTEWDVTSVLLIENQLTCKPKFLFSCTTTVSDITVYTPVTADELPVTWTTVTGADQYDLEWTYIDSSALANHKFGNPMDSSLVFYHNATRITTSGTSYNIPLIYDNHGTLFIRVRPVQCKSGNAVIAAIWSSDASPALVGAYEFNGHERPLNWQSNISFAEEGKRKVVVQYFDGSLRSRQTVTRDNTTNKTIVAETFYDYQGRPAIQVMPAPSLSNVIEYTASFNVSINGAEYTQSNFDTLPGPDLYCTIRADSMSSLFGASRYYAPNNPNKMIGMNQFIPDAKNYPFTETEYTQDNTGRISRQGGVGPDHQLGTGHETKYFYGTPDQNELDALFGTEVGDKSHYFKNMVHDANGQYSISYVDMHGRTIATALAGAAPPGMAALPSNQSAEVTESLADSGSVFFDGLNIIHQKSLVVAAADNYDFNYSLTPQVFAELNCDSIEICYTCLYDLEITITDNCNNQLLPGAKAFDTVIHNFSFGNISAECPADPEPLAVNFSLYLPEGSYQVTKKLTVNKDAYVYYRDSVYLPNNTCVSLEEFIEEQRSIIASITQNCAPECNACRDSLGTFEEFRLEFIEQAGILPEDSASFFNEILTAYNNAVTVCDDLCGDGLSDDNDIRAAMLQDMTPPYGQYADTSLAKSGDLYSIFFIPPADSASYVPVFRLPSIQYKDDNGNPDSVYNLEADLMVTPRTLTMSQFVQNFRSSWAEALLPFHPEYCKLLVLESLHTSNVWDRRMEAVDNFRDARDGGFLNPTGNGMYPFPIVTENIDPLSMENGSFKSALESKLNTYLAAAGGNPSLNMWGLSCMMARCDSGETECVSFYANPANQFDTTAMCEGDLDMAWRNFRQLYLGVKQGIVSGLVNNPTGCTPANQAYNTVPTNQALFAAAHKPQFSSDINETIYQNGLQYLNQANGSPQFVNQAKAQSENSLNKFFDETCRAYASEWARQLSPCAYNPQHLQDTILPRLIALCRLACDTDHPLGASTLPVGVTYTPAGTDYVFTSFSDIINAYNGLHNITDTLDCNGELITAPQPFDRQPAYTKKPVFSKPNECECGLINDLYNTFLLSNEGDASFAAFLERTQQILMTNAELNLLRDMCNGASAAGPGTGACFYLPEPIYLPPAMQCNTGTTCASCTLIDSLYTGYLEAYPSAIPLIADIDDTIQTAKNNLFKNYMNNRLGFALQAWEYLEFLATCDSSADEITDTVECVDRPVGNLFLFEGNGRLTDIQATSDNGYILAGASSGNGAGAEDGLIIKTNSTGMVQWTKTYGGTGDDHFTRVRHTSDNGYIAVGTTKSGRYPKGEMLVVKYNNSGTVQWSKTIGFNTVFGETGYDIVQTTDGGYAALGIYDQHTGNGEFMVARLDDEGDIEWVRRFGTSRLQADTCTPFTDTLAFTGSPAYGIIEKDDTLVIAGTAYDRNLGHRYFGVVYQVDDFTGELIRNWHYADSLNPAKSIWFRDIYATATGYTILANNAQHYGTDSMQAAVVQLSATGEVTGYKSFDLPAGSNRITSSGMHPTSDGGYLVAQTGNNGEHISWQRVDAEGFLQWAIETAIPGNQLLGRFIQNSNNSFTAVGVNNINQPLLVDLFPTTPTGCYDNSVTLGASDQVLTRITWALEGTEYLVPLHTDTTLTSTVLSTTDSSLICPGNGNCYTVYEGPRLCGKSGPLLPPLAFDSTGVCTDSTFFAVSKGTELSKIYKDSLTGAFEQRYNEICLQAYRYESFTVTHTKNEYYYTLYYYDQAGNLVRTVPPAGVQANHDSTWLAQVRAARATGEVLVPTHTLITNYRYNTLNQVVAQHTPDGGLSHFWYDRLGRLAVSQNARQYDSAQYSYTVYDTIGRITEVGQLESDTLMADSISRSQAGLQEWIAGAYTTAEQITRTVYDYEYLPLEPVMAARNLRNRVAWTALYNSAADVAKDSAATATYYSYDILGNVDTLVQDYRWGVMAENGNRFKKIVYEYDLISGKVNKVAYQPGQPDAFYHVYFYDAENRITHVQTSADSINWDNDAFYQYYDHGPLARTILGEQQVQGINYAYTLHGWLKAINPAVHTAEGYTLQPDGSSGSVVARPTYDILLNYYNNEYAAISGATPMDDGLSSTLGADHRPLFNGNISSMGVNITALTNPLLYNYQYDQLNRLVSMDAWHKTGSAWSNLSSIADFGERISYDPNGNILGYKRNGNNTFASSPMGMDSLSYKYITGTNQLEFVTDSVPAGNYSVDIDNQDAGNYGYDAIGNMTSDSAEGITNISWTVYGKISHIEKEAGTSIFYTYGAVGNRIRKTVSSEDTAITTWYVRDAQGNVMSVYTAGDDSVHSGELTQTEVHLYGSSRLGMMQRSTNVQSQAPAADTILPFLGTGYSITFKRGNKFFELSNHLGNVLATISDKKIGISMDDSTVDYLVPDVVSAQDYYPFGMLMAERNSGADYRFGFNGKENDNEVKGKGNQQDYGMRIYDPRLGRFLSEDPLSAEYAFNSPYAYAENDPVNYIDLDGLEKPGESATETPAPTKPKVDVKVDKDLLNGKNSGRLATLPKVPKAPKLPAPRRGKGYWPAIRDGIDAIKYYIELKKYEEEVKKQYREYIWGTPTHKPSNKAIIANLERLTTDPSSLPDEYLKEVEERIKNGTATIQDYLYQDEIARRKREGSFGNTENSETKNTFTKLSELEIRMLQEKFSEGDPDFIEKLKKPGGKGAGSVDLYKNDKTGEIVIIPKGQNNKNEGGEPTGYNTNDIKDE